MLNLNALIPPFANNWMGKWWTKWAVSAW